MAGCIKNWVVRMVSGSCVWRFWGLRNFRINLLILKFLRPQNRHTRVWRFWGLRNFRINKLILKFLHFKDLAGAVRHTQIFG